MSLKTPKGTRDYGPREMSMRKKIFQVITDVFERYGAVTIDTPVFEMRELLMGKYGEEGSRLVYDLIDQGGELCSLRYDLTVPFARYLAMNNIKRMRRYQISKVYRRDNPVMTKGRYREFYQCDFDIAGEYSLMSPESECLRLVDDILTELDIGKFETRINHRLLLDGVLALSGILPADVKTVCSSIDKLDKMPWSAVRDELLHEKHIGEESVGRLEQYVRMRELNPDLDNSGLLARFSEVDSPQVKQAVDELRLLLKYAEVLGCSPSTLVFEPSLARGLDYYTGAIYEVIVTAGESSVGIGSIAAGGRYDKLVGLFPTHNAKGKKEKSVPCAGVSIGIERLFTIMEDKSRQDTSLRISPTDVLVISAQKGYFEKRMEMASRLRSAGIRTEFASHKANPSYLQQVQYAEENKIALGVVIGEEEMINGFVRLKDIRTREEQKVDIDKLVEVIRARLLERSLVE